MVITEFSKETISDSRLIELEKLNQRLANIEGILTNEVPSKSEISVINHDGCAFTQEEVDQILFKLKKANDQICEKDRLISQFEEQQDMYESKINNLETKIRDYEQKLDRKQKDDHSHEKEVYKVKEQLEIERREKAKLEGEIERIKKTYSDKESNLNEHKLDVDQQNEKIIEE